MPSVAVIGTGHTRFGRRDDATVQELIDGMNRAAEEWASWQPTDQIGLIVHRAIEKCLQS